MTTPPSDAAIKAFRTPEIIAWQDRHRYTTTDFRVGDRVVHWWDVAENAEHEGSPDCPCKPISNTLDGFEFYFHEFDPTAAAPIPVTMGYQKGATGAMEPRTVDVRYPGGPDVRVDPPYDR